MSRLTFLPNSATTVSRVSSELFSEFTFISCQNYYAHVDIRYISFESIFFDVLQCKVFKVDIKNLVRKPPQK